MKNVIANVTINNIPYAHRFSLISLPMYTHLLTKKLPNLSAYTKYFLLRWAKDFDHEEKKISIEEISFRFEMSPKLVTKAIGEVTSLGLMARTRLARMKGEPSFKYQLNMETSINKVKRRFESIQRAEQQPVEVQEQIIDFILCNSIKDLNIPKKLLFAALWLQTNEVGMIDNIGVANLAKNVGCSKDSIRRYLNSLAETQLVRKVCSGFTAVALFGVKNSVYLLSPPDESPHFLIELPKINEASNLTISSVLNITAYLKDEFLDGKRLLGKIEADLNRLDVQEYFLYWFWQYVYSYVEIDFKNEGQRLNDYHKKALISCDETKLNKLAYSLFSPAFAKKFENNDQVLDSWCRKVHELAINTLLEAYPQKFEQFQNGGLSHRLRFILSDTGIYQK